MAMRTALVLVLAVAPAAADTFGGFSGVDAPYLVNQTGLCQPLEVKSGVAKGEPTCVTSSADQVAKLSIKSPIVQRGPTATFAATASGTTLTIKKKNGDPVVTWTTVDPIGKVVDVYASQYQDRVAVAYTVRRLGSETTRIVGFELVKTTGRNTPPTTSQSPPTGPVNTSTAPPEDPLLKKALDAARKATKGKALAAWNAVLGVDKDNSEATYRIATLQLAAKHNADAIAALEKLAKSARGDAIEWLVEARFDKAFAPVRGDAKFRAAVGLDRKATTPYERVMGFGGQWEQTGTSCETPEVKVTLTRDRAFKIKVKSVCQGRTFEQPFKGTWRINGDNVVLTLPNKGKQATAKDDAPCTIEKERDEDSLHCVLDRDLDFVVLPTRR